jgi:hypothetical protein
MSYSVQYRIGGVTYNLSSYDPTTGIDMQYIGALNLGGAPLHAITTRGALQQGDTMLDFRLDPRIITLIWYVSESSLSDLTTTLDKYHQIFTPSMSLGTLIITRDDGTQRAIDCYYIGGLDDNIDPKMLAVRLPVQLRCPDPTWYDPTQQIVSMVSGVDGTPTPYPYIIPVTYGSALTQTVSVSYTGTWRSFPIIEATGPITGFSITNDSTGENISLSSAIPAGSTYRFNLLYGYKTVTDQTGANKIATVTSGSDLATFSIESAPAVPGGVNSLTITGTGGTSASAVSLYYYTRYHGI